MGAEHQVAPPESDDGLGKALSRRAVLEKGAVAAAGLAAAGVAFPAGAGAALRSTFQASKEIRVGGLLSLTGVFAQTGHFLQRGAQLYVAQNGGKLGGLRVRFVFEDDQGDPSIGLQKAQKLDTESKVDVTFGVISSAVGLAVRDYYSRQNKPLFITNAIAKALTDPVSPYIFRTCLPSFYTYPEGPWAAKTLGRRAIVLYQTYSAGFELRDSFVAGFTNAGGRVVDTIGTPLGTADYSPTLTKLSSQDADFVWAMHGGTDAVNLVKQYDQRGLKRSLPLLGAAGLVGAEFIPAQGDAAIGVYMTDSWAPNLNSKVNLAFVKAYKKRYGGEVPANSVVFAYDTMQVLDIALKATGGDKTPSRLIRAVESAKWVSPRGPLAIDKKSHGVTQNMYLIRARRTSSGISPEPLLILGRITSNRMVSGQRPLPKR